MAAIIEKITPTDVFKFEGGEQTLFSRDNIVILAGQNLAIGTVLGQVTATGKYIQLTPASADGGQLAVGMLFLATDATAGDARAVMVARDAIAANSRVIWPVGITLAQKASAISQLAANGLILRTGV